MEHKAAFALWVTGLPASGKSTLAAEIKRQLTDRGVNAVVLESDVLRKVLTPDPKYDEGERETFYRQLAAIGALLAAQGVPVIFDATANRRAYREEARRRIERFQEIYVDSPLEVCAGRDPKGIYRQGRSGSNTTVPGLQSAYEAPEHPAAVIHGDHKDPSEAAARVVGKLVELGYLEP